MIFDKFKKGEKKTEASSVRFSTDDKQFMKTFGISPTKVFDEGLKVAKKKVKKEKKKNG